MALLSQPLLSSCRMQIFKQLDETGMKIVFLEVDDEAEE